MKFLLLLLLSTLSYGAAYTPKKGHGIIIGGIRSYESRHSFDTERVKNKNSNNGKFSKNELSYFLEYGLGKNYSFLASGTLYLKSRYSEDSFESESVGSLGDQYIGIKKLYSQSSLWRKAIQLSVSFPLYSRDGDLLAGNHQHDLELRHHWDYLGNWLGTFQIIELAYRLRFDQPADEVRLDYTIGKSFSPFLLLFQSALTYGMRNHEVTSDNINTNLSSDYDLLVLSLIGVYEFYTDWSLSLGFSKDVWGRKVSAGNALAINIWKKF